MLRPGIGLVELMAVVVEGYADRPALAHRATELIIVRRSTPPGAVLPRYETISYAELWEPSDRTVAARCTASRAGRATGSPPWVRRASTTRPSTWRSLGSAGVSVPLHAGAPLRRLQPVVEETEPSVLACSAEHLDDRRGAVSRVAIDRRLVVFDHDEQVDDHRDTLCGGDEQLAAGDDRVVVETWPLLDRGRHLVAPPVAGARPRATGGDHLHLGEQRQPEGSDAARTGSRRSRGRYWLPRSSSAGSPFLPSR